MSFIAIVIGALFLGIAIADMLEEGTNLSKVGFSSLDNQLQISIVMFAMMLIASIVSFVYFIFKEHKIKKIKISRN